MKPQCDRSLHAIRFGVLTCLLATVFNLSAGAAESNLNKTFQVKPGGQLTIDSDRGSIDITTSDRTDLSVEVRRKVSKASDAEAAEFFAAYVVTFEQEGDRVVVRGKMKESARKLFNWGRQNLEVKYVVLAPKRFDFDLRTAAGSITSADIDGKVKARTAGGSLRFAGVTGSFDGMTSAGEIRSGDIGGSVVATTSGGSIHMESLGSDGKLRTSAGSITVGHAKAMLAANTSGGSIHLGESEGSAELATSAGSIGVKSARGALHAVTSGGSITIDEAHDIVNADTSAGSINATFVSQPPGDCKLTTAGGSITLKMDSELAFELDARTSGGKVTTEIPVATTVSGSGASSSLKGKLNGGGKALVLRTSAGNINIRRK